MVTLHLVPDDIRDDFEVHEWRNAAAILKEAHPDEWNDLLDVLRGFKLYRSHILKPGGQKSGVSASIDQQFYARGWAEVNFDTKITVGETETPVPTHKVDCFKNGVGLEVEWNNKDPFYDRDLNNFRLLFELRVLEVGVMITRADELQAIADELGRGKSYGASTTHMSKLLPKMRGSGGGGCPLLIFGITRQLYVED